MSTASAPARPAGFDRSPAGLLGKFQQIAQRHGFTLDPSQQRALSAFQRLYGELHALEKNRRPWLRLWSRPQRVSGIYLWGPVGRGKSFLMDEFFHLVPFA